jgi:peptidyl-prolyl cis-trans isomerase C
MKKIVLAILISLMMLPAANAAVVAKVGTLEITDEDVDTRLKQIPPQYKATYASEAGRKMLLEQLVQEKLIYIQAGKEKYDTNAEVQKQLEKAKQRLMVGQYITDVFKNIQVTESELKTYYDENKAMFVQKEQVKAKHILCKTHEEAAAARERIIKGESFEEVAKTVSIGPSAPKGGDLGWFEKERMVPEFANMAFSLEIDTVSDPVKTQFGYHLIKVYEKKAAGTKSFAAAEAELERTLIGNKQKERMDEVIRKVKEENLVTVY